MIHDNFKINEMSEALLDFNDLLRAHSKNDSVQGFDKWDEAVLSMVKKPDEYKHFHVSELVQEPASTSPRNWNLSWLCICRIRSRQEKRQVILD